MHEYSGRFNWFICESVLLHITWLASIVFRSERMGPSVLKIKVYNFCKNNLVGLTVNLIFFLSLDGHINCFQYEEIILISYLKC